jgi:nitrate reductase NapD
MPALAVGTVGSYGLGVWIYQMFAGPPGPPPSARIDPRTAKDRRHGPSLTDKGLLDKATLNRRALITGRVLTADRVVAPPGCEIASIIVQARPERLDELEAEITALPGCEIHGRDPRGKLVVVTEAPDAGSLGTCSTPSSRCRTSIRPRSSFHAIETPESGRAIMTSPELDRRQMLKLEAAAIAAAAAGLPAPALAPISSPSATTAN